MILAWALFVVAVPIFGDIGLSLVSAGAFFGDMELLFERHPLHQLSVFSTPDASGKRYQGNLGERAGCGLRSSWSDHARIGRTLEWTFHGFCCGI